MARSVAQSAGISSVDRGKLEEERLISKHSAQIPGFIFTPESSCLVFGKLGSLEW